jgi:hypothetical protein
LIALHQGRHDMKKSRLILTLTLTILGWGTAVHADTSDLMSVPEPETIVFLGLVLVGFGAYGLYRRKKKSSK